MLIKFISTGFVDCKRWEDFARVFRHANGIPVLLCKASWCRPPTGWSREGEGTSEDILARLADGKRRLKENEFKLISYGNFREFTINTLTIRRKTKRCYTGG